jgi:hypothetical protein
MRPGTFVVGKVQEGLDLVQAGVRVALLMGESSRSRPGTATPDSDHPPSWRRDRNMVVQAFTAFISSFESGKRSYGSWLPCSGRI